MAGRLVEFFGYAPLDLGGRYYAAQKRCPFVDGDCIKPNHGGCTLELTDLHPVIMCPNRLYQNRHAVLHDVAVQAFGKGVQLTTAPEIAHLKTIRGFSGNEVAVFGKYWGSELSIPQPKKDDLQPGGFYIDYILARLSVDGVVSDFTAVEVQTIDTTNSYKASSDRFFAGEDFIDHRGNNPGWTEAGLNWANVSKRILPQLIYKGYVLRRERLCSKGLFFICPTAVLNKIRARLGTKMLDYPIAAGTITFQAYDLGAIVAGHAPRELVKGETFTTTIEQVAYAFVSPINLPKMGVYEDAIVRAMAPPSTRRRPAAVPPPPGLPLP